MQHERHDVAKRLLEKNVSVYNPIAGVIVYENVNVLFLMSLVN